MASPGALPATSSVGPGSDAQPGSPSRTGYYNPRPSSPMPARIVITPAEPDAQGTPRITATVQVEEGGASSMSSVATLCNSAIGAGVLSLPFAFRCAGLLGGLALCLGVGAAESFSLYVLSKFAERYGAHSYGSLVRRALGRKLSSTLSAIMLLYLFGSCVAYLVIIGDTFSSLAGQAFGVSVWTDRHPVLLAVGIIFILPMCFATSLSALDWVSAGAVVGFLYTSVAILWRGGQVVMAREDRWQDVLLWQPNLKEALYAISILVFGFNSSANTISIFSELDNYPHRLVVLLPQSPKQYATLSSLAPRPYTYKLIGMLGVIIVSMSLIAAGYIGVGAAGYMAFPTSVSSNILNTFPADDPIMQVARGVIGLMVTGHYPINFNPARVAFCDLLDTLFNVTSVSYWAEALFTVVFFAATLATAMVVTNLGSVLHLIGGTAATFMIFLLPGLLCWNAAVIKATASVSSNLAEAGEAPPSEGPSAPLLIDKKAGLRTHGVLFLSSAKTWWAGLGLVVLAVLVMAITMLTTGGGAH